MHMKDEVQTEDSQIRKPQFPATRIKKIMYSNEDIGKTGALVAGVMSIATEEFISGLVKLTCEKTEAEKITIEDIKEAVKGETKYDFISMMDD